MKRKKEKEEGKGNERRGVEEKKGKKRKTPGSRGESVDPEKMRVSERLTGEKGEFYLQLVRKRERKGLSEKQGREKERENV